MSKQKYFDKSVIFGFAGKNHNIANVANIFEMLDYIDFE